MINCSPYPHRNCCLGWKEDCCVVYGLVFDWLGFYDTLFLIVIGLCWVMCCFWSSMTLVVGLHCSLGHLTPAADVIDPLPFISWFYAYEWACNERWLLTGLNMNNVNSRFKHEKVKMRLEFSSIYDFSLLQSRSNEKLPIITFFETNK